MIETQARRIVVLTFGGDHAVRILVGLSLAEVAVEGLLIAGPAARANPLPSGAGRWRPGLLRRRAVGVIRRALRRVRAPSAEPPGPWTSLASEVDRVGPLNGEPMLRALERLAPDYLVLAGVGIVDGRTLAIPKRGTINVHPGLLPWIRGVGVIERAVERRIPVGLTAHFVDTGIDSGEIIHRELVPVQAYDTLASLRRKAYERCAQVMVEIVAAVSRGDHPRSFAQSRRFRYCTEPSSDECSRIDQDVRRGVATSLYRQWRHAFGGNVLPAEEVIAPEMAESVSR